jgi:hypothetical protein
MMMMSGPAAVFDRNDMDDSSSSTYIVSVEEWILAGEF